MRKDLGTGCVNSDNSSGETCKTYDATGADMTVSLSPPSGYSNRYYVYPGNTYYIYRELGMIIISTTEMTVDLVVMNTVVNTGLVVTKTAVIWLRWSAE